MGDSVTTILIGNALQYVSLSVYGRTHPDAQDYWDGNWLNADVKVVAGQFDVSVSGCIRAEELVTFCDQLLVLRDTLTGCATFKTMESWLALELSIDRRGRIDLSGVLHDRNSNRLQFRLDVDQSYLKNVITTLDTLLSEFPVIGTR